MRAPERDFEATIERRRKRGVWWQRVCPTPPPASCLQRSAPHRRVAQRVAAIRLRVVDPTRRHRVQLAGHWHPGKGQRDLGSWDHFGRSSTCLARLLLMGEVDYTPDTSLRYWATDETGRGFMVLARNMPMARLLAAEKAGGKVSVRKLVVPTSGGQWGLVPSFARSEFDYNGDFIDR